MLRNADAYRTADGLLELVGGDLRVPLVGGEWVRYANLDNAASAPALRQVADAVAELLPYYGSVHRGAGFASLVSTEAYTRAREVVREFVGAREDDLVLFTRNTTDAFNLLAGVLPAGTTVLTFTGEHHANLLPWRRGDVRHLGIPASPADALDVLEAELRALGGRHRARLGDGRLERDGRGVADRGDRPHRASPRCAGRARRRPAGGAPSDRHRRLGRRLRRLLRPQGLRPVRRGRPRRARGLARHGPAAPRGRRRGAQRHRRRRRMGDRPGTPRGRHPGGARRLRDRRRGQRAGRRRAGSASRPTSRNCSSACSPGLDAIGGVRTYELWERGHDRVGVVSFNVADLDPALLAAALAAADRPQRQARQRPRRPRRAPARVDLRRRADRVPARPAGVNGEVMDEAMATGAVVAGRGTFEPAKGWGGDHHDGVPIFILSRQGPGVDPRWPLVTYVPDVETVMASAKGGRRRQGRPRPRRRRRPTRPRGRSPRRDPDPPDPRPPRRGPPPLRAPRRRPPRARAGPRVLEGSGITHLRYRVCASRRRTPRASGS